MLLDENGVMASTGSACSANKQTRSHVLKALGLDDAQIRGSLRLSVGLHTTVEQIEVASKIIVNCIKDTTR